MFKNKYNNQFHLKLFAEILKKELDSVLGNFFIFYYVLKFLIINII